MTRIELNPNKSLRLTLQGDMFEVTQLTPRYVRISGSLRDWSLDLKTDRAFLHCMSGLSPYIGFALSDKEARAVREKFELLGLRVESPESPAPSLKPDSLQASAAGATPAPDSAIAAGAGVVGVAS